MEIHLLYKIGVCVLHMSSSSETVSSSGHQVRLDYYCVSGAWVAGEVSGCLVSMCC